MDKAVKDTLLERFEAYLDGLDDGEDRDDGEGGEAISASSDTEEMTDLFSIFVEIAATRNEMRAQSRLTKEAFDQFRSVFETLQSSHALLEQELKTARSREAELSRSALRPLLLDIIDIRDRLATGLASMDAAKPAGWLERWIARPGGSDAWREGMTMTFRRLDQVLAARRVVPVPTIGRPFAPTVARVVATVDDPAVADGTVVGELRAGFTWDGELLRPAEVTVARNATSSRVDERVER